ncbi:malonic semialdehyde reductase [Corallococcus macrosporus]|uniref:Putative NADH dehydrogenase/NAD(P)H nitroreductase LILAB_01285 n=1 Tax=Myxococcus fulvus (strain ATCC BAA-855 / HW-1) TaxID=483219 RepID=F8CB84_MYXFH|nr:malonic semialdehyde reductase [Corallococcus macrosporus]AEI62189.1 malonic semialdehyde reductase [Corallococcus macrosporus]
MSEARSEELALLFREARTHNAWLDRPVDDALLARVYELARMGPTSANAHPMRLVFVKSADAKAKLLPAVLPLNFDKVRTAPVTAIVAYDSAFYEFMPQLFPARPEMRDVMAGYPAEGRAKLAEQSAFLGAGYVILAARALGLDVGPLGGFDPAGVDAAFFPDGKWRSVLLLNLGYGDSSQLHPRNPRLSFGQACRVA